MAWQALTPGTTTLLVRGERPRVRHTHQCHLDLLEESHQAQKTQGWGLHADLRSTSPSQLGVSVLGSFGDIHGAPKLELGCPSEKGCKQGLLCFPFCPPPPDSLGAMERAKRESLSALSKSSAPKGKGSHCPAIERTQSFSKYPSVESPPRALSHLGHPTYPTLTLAPGWVEATTPAQTPPSRGSLLPRVPLLPSHSPQVPTAPQPPRVPSPWARLLISSCPGVCSHPWGCGAQDRPGQRSGAEGCSAWC